MLTAAVASFLLGLAGLSGMHSRSRGVTPVQEAVVSVNGTAHADTPPTTDKPSEFGGSPTDKAVAVTIVSKDPADDGAWNVSTGAGVVPLDEKGCPPCDNLFGMLRSSSHHRLVQDVHMQVGLEHKNCMSDVSSFFTMTKWRFGPRVVLGSGRRLAALFLGLVRFGDSRRPPACLPVIVSGTPPTWRLDDARYPQHPISVFCISYRNLRFRYPIYRNTKGSIYRTERVFVALRPQASRIMFCLFYVHLPVYIFCFPTSPAPSFS